MKTRPTSDHDRQRLKGATDRAIKRAGGVSVFSLQTRVEPPALSKYRAPHEDGAFMPIDVAVDCDMAAGAPVILSAMATGLGYSIAPVDVAPGKVGPVMVGTLIREIGEVSAVVLDAMADGTISDNERNAISKEIDEALAALWALRAGIANA